MTIIKIDGRIVNLTAVAGRADVTLMQDELWQSTHVQ